MSLKGAYAILKTQDDGRGFPEAAEPERGLCLKTMRYRASLLRDELQVVRTFDAQRRGTGVTLTCHVPVHSRRFADMTAAAKGSSRK